MAARVLLIEDNPTNMLLMTYLLEAFGHTPLCAGDGEEGLAAALRERPDLIICDIQLPKMSGYEVARHLKSHPALRAIPLVAMTAFAMVGDREKVLAAGFDAYLTKPIEPQTFIQQLAHYLPLNNPSLPAPPAPERAEPAVRAAKGATLLVVDNAPSNLELARSLFEAQGYQVRTAGNMRDAFALTKEIVPDLILSDICMADGNGYDFIKLVKETPQLRDIPFVFITSTWQPSC